MNRQRARFEGNGINAYDDRLTDRRRSAFTLLEILLVMVVIVIVSTIAIVNLRHAFANTRLKKGAESIRAEFARARIKAIKSGQTQVFRHIVGDNGFVTAAQTSAEDLLESDGRFIDAASLGIDTEEGNVAERNIGPIGNTTDLERLPEGVYFMGSDVSMDARAESKLSNYPELAGSSVSGGEAVAGGWGVPVFFFPDGNTTTARLVLANKKGFAVSVELRGLTGIAKVGQMRAASEISALGTLP